MKRSFSRLLKFTAFFIVIILSWSYQDGKDFNAVFEVVEGELIDPSPVTDIQTLYFINELHVCTSRKAKSKGYGIQMLYITTNHLLSNKSPYTPQISILYL